MPVYDTPITTDDTNLKKVIGQKLPVVLYLYDKPDKSLDDAFTQAAKENAGDILFVKVNAADNPTAYAQYGRPALPALVTLDEGSVESKAARIRPADVEAHVDFLLGQGPMPQETAAESDARAANGSAPVHVSEASFASDVLGSPVPVLVDFWAPWCGPCHMVAPVLERLAEQYAGKIKIAKLNVDENPRLSQQYQVMGIPALIMFKRGQQVGKLVGAHPQPNIERLIQEALR
jgi:thioredoxin 1